MRRTTVGSGLALLAALCTGFAIPWLAEHIKIESIDKLTEDSTSLNEHEEAAKYDKEVPADTMAVNFKPIHLGDLSVECPTCKTEVDLLNIGLSMLEDRETGNGEFNDLLPMGVILYPCGHVVFSRGLWDRVASILNAEEIGKLSPALFVDLAGE